MRVDGGVLRLINESQSNLVLPIRLFTSLCFLEFDHRPKIFSPLRWITTSYPYILSTSILSWSGSHFTTLGSL